jgi:hypothetical protein
MTMSLVRKLKPDRNITGVIIPLSLIPIWGITTLIFSIQIGLMVVAILLWIIALIYLYAFARTGNGGQLFLFFYAVFLGLITLNADSEEWRLAYLSGIIFFGFVLVYLVLTRKMKWRGREIFELAAEQVDENGNGYTSRPRPVGKVIYSPEQIRLFARFCARHLIALPYYTSKNTTLVLIKMGEEYGRLLGLSGDYRDATWINFDIEGEVSVHIAQKDYLDYREPLVFDQLCTSLGQLFIDFFELYNKGEGVRVIDRMDDMQIAVIS